MRNENDIMLVDLKNEIKKRNLMKNNFFLDQKIRLFKVDKKMHSYLNEL